MGPTNHSMVSSFIIKGVSDSPQLQLPVFLLVLLIYLVTVCSNMTLFVLVCRDSYLHTPMYFFLANLSLVDMSSSTVSLHRIFINYLSGKKEVSYASCITQLYFYGAFTVDSQALLAAMSYDRYVAICNSLRYHMVMTNGVCYLLIFICWLVSFLEMLLPVVFLTTFSCYTSNEINHFFCDIVPLMDMICDDITLLQIICNTVLVVLFNVIPFIFTFTPYIFIVFTILRIQSSNDRKKVFYTCSSHITVVILLYVTLLCQYFRPQSFLSLDFTKFFSLFNTAIVPMLNPLIYSLKNKDVKSAIKRWRMHWGF